MRQNGPTLDRSKRYRRNSGAVAVTVILGFSLIYGVTAFWRPAAQDTEHCTACCILPEGLGELEPIPLDEEDWPLHRDTSFAEPSFDTLSKASRRPTLAPPAAEGNVGYGPAIEIVVEAKQLGTER